MSNRYLLRISGVFVIAILSALLYIPFLNNALVFDDHGVFSTLSVYDHAQRPFDLRPRTFPYFTLGLVQVLIGSIEAHRVVSLVLHTLCALMLFALLTTLLHQALHSAPALGKDAKLDKRVTFVAFIGALWFAIHPVAVYGAGYLVQRTILFATLFSLLSLWFYHRAVANNRTADFVISALFYSAAVFSKEHAVMLPLAAVTLTALYSNSIRSNVKRIGLYLAMCAPAAITVVFTVKYLVAASYEPYIGVLFEQIHSIPLLEKPGGPWLVSMILQAGFFFDYVGYWIAPDIRFMSIDMRINFTEVWSAWWMTPKAILFLACPITAFFCLRRGGLLALFGCGLLYSWLLFFTELASVRFQEPFVLYRSYLWAPGYVMMIAAICCAFPLRWTTILSIPLLLVCIWLAQERLKSLASESTVWKDAAAKLESESIVGAGRIFHMRGLQHMKEKQFDLAIADFTRAIPHHRTVFQNYYQRGIAYYSLQDLAKAQADFDYAIKLNKKDGAVHYARGMVLERHGCFDEARSSYSESLKLGLAVAKLKLNDLSKKTASEDPQRANTKTCAN